MYRVEIKDRTKEKETAAYYMENTSKLYELWKENEENIKPEVSEVELKIGAKQDFLMERSWLVLHNTKGFEGRYYVASLTAKIRWAVCEGKFLKLGSFTAVGICRENNYAEGGFEQITCCGNPVLNHYSSSIVPLVSDFEDDFSREKITMLGYKVLAEFSSMEEVNADIAGKRLTDGEVESLLHDIPGELG